MAGGNNNDNSDEQPRFPHPPPDDVRYVQQLTDLPATTSGPAEDFIQDLGHPESAERSTLPGAAQFLTAEELSALGHHGPNAPQYGTAEQQHASHALDSQGHQALGHPVSAERSTLPSGTQFLTPEELSALGPHGPNASHYSTAEQHHASHAVDPQGYQSFMEMLGPVPAFGPPQDPFNLQQGVYGAVAQPGGTQYDYQIGQSMVSPGHHTTGSTYPLVTSAGYSQSMQDPTTYAGGLTTFPDFASTTTFQQTSPTLTRGPGLQSDRRATRSASQATSNIYPSGGPSHTQQGAPRQWIVPRPSGGQSGQHRLGYSSQTGGEDVEEFGHGQRLMQVDSATYASNPEDSVKEEPETRKAGGKRKRPLTEEEREHKRVSP